MNTTLVAADTLLVALTRVVAPTALTGLVVAAFVLAGRHPASLRPLAFGGCWAGLLLCGLYVVATAETTSGFMIVFSDLLGNGEWIIGALVGLVGGGVSSYVDRRLAGVRPEPVGSPGYESSEFRRVWKVSVWTGHATAVAGAGLGLLILFGSPLLHTFVVSVTLSSGLGWLTGRLVSAAKAGSADARTDEKV